MTRITRFFAAPVFQDEEKQRVANLLNVILNVILAITFLVTLALTVVDAASFWGRWDNPAIIGSMVISILVMRFLLQHGKLQLASALLSSALLAITTASIYGFSGIRNSTTGIYLLCITLAGLLLGGRAAIIFALLSVAATLGVWYAEISGLVVYKPISKLPEPFDAIAYSGIFILGGLLLRDAANNITRSLERAHRNERAQLEANLELQKLRASLEQQVADRTRDLEYRTNYLEASVQVSRAASSILDVDELTRQVIEMIRERFSLYYVGLFLVDATGKWAVLQAGTGEAGRAMRARRHRLSISAGSTVGWSIAEGKSRIVQETGDGTVRLATDELPNTRSETTLPLHSRGQVIGALTVQSDQLDVFDETTVSALQSMADQVAVALDNARLFTESQAALEAERRAYRQLGREMWSQMLRSGLTRGYGYVGQHVIPIGNEQSPEMDAALRAQKSIVVADQANPTLALPIQVRGQTIGVVDLRKDDPHSVWTAEEVWLIETLTEQLGVALESARLYQDAQRLAARERLINEITARIRSTASLDSVLNSAVREISALTGASYAAIDLELAEEVY